jgi:hypothetical protein
LTILLILPPMIFSRISAGLALVLLAHLGQLDFLFLGDEVGRHVGGLVVRRVHRGHVHGEATRQVGVAALEFDQHADLAAVHVGGRRVGAVDPAMRRIWMFSPSLAMAAARDSSTVSPPAAWRT